MNISRILIIPAGLLFAVFLASPTFADVVRGDGTVIMMPGIGAVLWHLTLAPLAFGHLSRDSLLCGSLLFTHITAFAFPVFYFTGALKRPLWCGVFGVSLIISLAPISWLIHDYEHVGFGAYAWIMSLLLAFLFCLLSFRRKHAA